MREIAITQGKIADILVSRGELDEALRIRTEEQLPVLTRLGDVRSIAAAQWKTAQIELARENIKDAAPRIAEAFAAFDRLGEVEGIAVVGALFGQIVLAMGRQDEGRAVLEKSVRAFQKLGHVEQAKQVQALLDQIGDAA